MVKSAAEKLIKRYGDAAPEEAAQRAEELRIAGDIEGYELWMRIRAAAEALLSDPPNGTRH